jgi:hypothetical protein
MVDLNEIHDSMYDNVRGYPLGISLFCNEAPECYQCTVSAWIRIVF